MKKIKIILLLILYGCHLLLLAGCWNYRELDKTAIVAGVAIDEGKDRKYMITVEIIDINTKNKETNMGSNLISMEGETIFDAVREMIALTNHKLYWSHSKAVIISENIASKGIVPLIDWLMRDSETRAEMKVFISKNPTAREILKKHAANDEIVSFKIAESLENQKNLAEAPNTNLWDVVSAISNKGRSLILPTISLDTYDGKLVQHVQGISIFKQDKLIGFLNDKQAKYTLFLLDQISGGILHQKIPYHDAYIDISLEIFENKTKVTSTTENGKVKVKVEVKPSVSIAEVGGSVQLMDTQGKNLVIEETEKYLQKSLEDIITKVQNEFGVDIFGFGEKIHKQNPQLWKSVGSQWGDMFQQLDVSVKVKVNVKNSALLSKPIKVGD